MLLLSVAKEPAAEISLQHSEMHLMPRPHLSWNEQSEGDTKTPIL